VTTHTTTGLKANWKQFTLLVIINAFCGWHHGGDGMYLLPKLRNKTFSAMLSFIVVFGTVKAISNYFAGSLANHLPKSHSYSLKIIKKIQTYTKEFFL